MEKLALEGGSPARTTPFAEWPIYDELELKYLTEVLESGKWGGAASGLKPGFEPKLPQLERKFAELQQAGHAVSVVNGTVAITVALLAAGLKPGDEVIVPPYTFIATATAALACGMIPVFADVEEDTLSIDPETVEAVITPKTRAIIAVHIGGAPANMTRLREIADKHGLVLIEDAAQAVGASWDGKGVGAIGDLGTFSLQSSKNLNAGEGGMITTNNREYWEHAWSLCNVGRVPNGGWYQHERFGQNYRMSEFQAAVALAQMTRLEQQMAVREERARLLDECLSNTPGIRLLRHDPRITRHAWHLYLFRLDIEPGKKAEFIRKAGAEGIPLSSGYIPLNRNRSVLDRIELWTGQRREQECPVCERLSANEAVWLSQEVLLSDEQAIREVAHGLGKVAASM